MAFVNQFEDSKRKDESNVVVPEEKPQEDKAGPAAKALPSYTAMIAQAILNKTTQRSTLSEIYEFMERRFLPLSEKGNGWRNCVRHTLSLSDCFMKLHRPENGRSCHWAVHPSYLPRFLRGDYRKRRQSRSRRNNQATTQDQYSFPQMIYERDAAAYNSRMLQMNASSSQGELVDHSRHYHVPTCTGMMSAPYSQAPQGHISQHSQHSQQLEQAALHHGQYNREYKPSEMFHPYMQNHYNNY